MTISKNKLGSIWLTIEGEFVNLKKTFRGKIFLQHFTSSPWTFFFFFYISNKEYNCFIISETDVWQFFSALLFSNILQLSCIHIASLLAKTYLSERVKVNEIVVFVKCSNLNLPLSHPSPPSWVSLSARTA